MTLNPIEANQVAIYKIAHEYQEQIWLAVTTGLVNCMSSAQTPQPPSLPANMGPHQYGEVAPHRHTFQLSRMMGRIMDAE